MQFILRALAGGVILAHQPRGVAVELRQLRTFVIVAEELHFGRAARRLFVAQSSVSQQLQRLEAELGVVLFHRTSRRTVLTKAGSAFLADVKAILSLTEQAADRARSLGAGRTGPLTIGTNFPAARRLLLPLLSTLRASRPGLATIVQELGTLEQQRALEDGDLDIGLLYGPVTSPALAGRHLHDVGIAALLRADHPLAGEGSLGLRSAAAYPHTVGRGGGARAIAERVSAAAARAGSGLGPEVADLPENFFLHIASSDTIAFTSQERAAQGKASGLAVMEIDPAPAALELHVAWNPAVDEPLVNIVLEALAELETS